MQHEVHLVRAASVQVLGRPSVSGHSGAYGVYDCLAFRKDAQDSQCTRINYSFPIDQYLELSITPVDRVDVRLQLPTKTRRHTDGVQPGDSIRAIPDGDTSHRFAPDYRRKLMILVQYHLRVKLEPSSTRREGRPPDPRAWPARRG